MQIKPTPLSHFIDHYFGYGSWQARMWFVGYEEGGGDFPEEVAAKLDYFYEHHPASSTPALCDIRKVYKQIPMLSDGPKGAMYPNRYDYRFGAQAVQHGVWKNLISFAHAFQGKEQPDLLAFQRQLFADADSANEALIQLFPLPSPHNHAWYYSWLDLPDFPFLKRRLSYEEHLFPIRIKAILTNIAKFQPHIVLMFGMTNINAIKNSVETFFPGAQFTLAKAVKQKIPQHHRAKINGTTLIITTQIPALRHNRIETGFDWKLFGETVSDHEFSK